MSALFFKVSSPIIVDSYRDLQKRARQQGLSLLVHDDGDPNDEWGVPYFLFSLTGAAGKETFSDLADVEEALATLEKEAGR